MVVTPVKTHKITADDTSMEKILDMYITNLEENSVVAVTSKIVGICEGRIVPVGSVDKEVLIKREAERYIPKEYNAYSLMVTINNHVLGVASGIDESNSNGMYSLWPEDLQKSTNAIRKFLREKFKLHHVGVVLTDSKTTPLRWGVTGIGIAWSGFKAINDFIGKPDIFGRDLHVTKVNIMDSLAGAGVFAMGESNEQTPLAVITDIPHIVFVDNDPTEDDFKEMYISPEEDIYGQMILKAPWEKGGRA